MKKQLLLGLMLVASIPAFGDVQVLLDCDSNNQTTQGMYSCTWRDLVVAERDLQKIVDQRNSQRPERKAALDARIVHWKKARDKNCKKIAHHDWAGGSEEPVAAMICRAADTQDMVKTMKKDHTVVPCKNSVRVCHDG